MVFLLDKDEDGFVEPRGAEPLLRFVSLALDALQLFAVDTREEAAVVIIDPQSSSLSPSEKPAV